MSDPYAYARERVAAKLAEWNQGTVTLVRTTEATPEKPWRAGEPTQAVFTLDAVVRGVTEEYLGITTVTATDLMIKVSPMATDEEGAAVSIEPRMADSLVVDGAPKVPKRIQQLPAAGDPAAFLIFVAS